MGQVGVGRCPQDLMIRTSRQYFVYDTLHLPDVNSRPGESLGNTDALLPPSGQNAFCSIPSYFLGPHEKDLREVKFLSDQQSFVARGNQHG